MLASGGVLAFVMGRLFTLAVMGSWAHYCECEQHRFGGVACLSVCCGLVLRDMPGEMMQGVRALSSFCCLVSLVHTAKAVTEPQHFYHRVNLSCRLCRGDGGR